MNEPARRARMSPAGRRITAAGIAVIGLAVTVFAARLGTEADRAASPMTGAPVPGLSLPRLDGGDETGGDETVELAALDENHRATVVNFFASWCLQCRNEHADLTAVAEAYRGRSVRFLGVVFQDDPDRARAFLDELGWSADFEYAVDPGARAAIEFGIFGVPETVFIRGGRVVGKLLGETDALTLSATLEQILAGEEIESRQVGGYRQNPDG